MKIKILIAVVALILLTGCHSKKEQKTTESTEAKSSQVRESSDKKIKKETNKAVIEVEK